MEGHPDTVREPFTLGVGTAGPRRVSPLRSVFGSVPRVRAPTTDVHGRLPCPLHGNQSASRRFRRGSFRGLDPDHPNVNTGPHPDPLMRSRTEVGTTTAVHPGLRVDTPHVTPHESSRDQGWVIWGGVTLLVPLEVCNSWRPPVTTFLPWARTYTNRKTQADYSPTEPRTPTLKPHTIWSLTDSRRTIR